MNISRALLFPFLLATAPAWATPTIGAAAPDFTATDSAGKAVHLSDFRGKVVVLEWTNDGCPFVRKHYDSGNMQALQKLAASRDAVWLSVISSAPGKQGNVSGAAADELSRSRGATPAHVVLDASGAVGHLFEAKATPDLFIVDGRGTLVYMGGIDSIASTDPDDIARATPYFRNALTQTLAGEPVTEPLTRPYGCAVKY